ncbi:MAG: hypothetical protein HDS16_00320 [Bacteroides sp.]|nr:hypothetical protein [Bacteroides sp.]
MNPYKNLIKSTKQIINSILYENNLLWTFGILICILILTYSISYLLTPQKAANNISQTAQTAQDVGGIIREIIGFVCGIASIFGILLALLQNKKTKDDLASVKTLAEANTDHEKELRKAIAKVNSEHNAEIKQLRFQIIKQQQIESVHVVISKLQESIRLLTDKDPSNKLDFMIWICSEIYDEILPVRQFLKNNGDVDLEKEITKHVKKIGTNKSYFVESKRTGTKDLMINEIIKDLNAFHITVSELKIKLNEPEYGAKI